MKKYNGFYLGHTLIALCVLILVAISFASCSSDPFAGKIYVEQDEPGKIVVPKSSQGGYESIMEKFGDELSSNETLIFNKDGIVSVVSSGSVLGESTDSYEYKFKDRELTIKGSFGIKLLKYARVNKNLITLTEADGEVNYYAVKDSDYDFRSNPPIFPGRTFAAEEKVGDLISFKMNFESDSDLVITEETSDSKVINYQYSYKTNGKALAMKYLLKQKQSSHLISWVNRNSFKFLIGGDKTITMTMIKSNNIKDL